MIPKRMKVAAAAVALASAGGCVSNTVCLAIVEASLAIDARDSVTGADVTAGTTVIAHRRSTATGPVEHTDSITPQGSPVALFSGTGVFDLTLLHTGYARWTRSNVIVKSTGGSCPQPQQVNITARLVPIP